MAKRKVLPKDFPFKVVFGSFISDYSKCTTYWYVPKTRALNDDNVLTIKAMLKIIFDDFLGHIWNTSTQDKILKRFVGEKILEPYKTDSTVVDRTALTRIIKKLLETLGLLWVQEDHEIVLTDAALDVIGKDNPRPIIETQIAKYQYPNPGLTTSYAKDFEGILPHLFLLQVLQQCDYKISFAEYELFMNLSQSQNDVSRIVKYIKHWRDLNTDEQTILVKTIADIPMARKTVQGKLFEDEEDDETRFRRIKLGASYQRSLFSYPGYLAFDETEGVSYIVCRNPKQVNDILDKYLASLKITLFDTLEDWQAYFGNPELKPSWFTYLLTKIEDAPTAKAAEGIVKKHAARLTAEEKKEIERKQIEKKIEDFYVDSLAMIEEGLTLVNEGRQYSTPIGRIDLFCRCGKTDYVVIEIKANDADDASFGQILRYIGWVSRNVAEKGSNVRGIILAGKFPETARYSRIGLLKKDYKEFIKFKTHGLNLSDS